jgi:hypothetical protein
MAASIKHHQHQSFAWQDVRRTSACLSLLPDSTAVWLLLYCDRFLTDLASEEHPVRRLMQAGGKGLGGTYHHDAGALDTALAASATINKAVKTPSLGSVTFATRAGLNVAKVAAGNRNHAG